jgi:hypothetical protein
MWDTCSSNSFIFNTREYFLIVTIQSESAATLEAESGYSMEAPEVSEFRQYILDGSWILAEAALMRLGVSDDEGLLVNRSPEETCRYLIDCFILQDAKFLISQQKYLELLESQKTTAALHVLRNELAPLNVDPDQLHTLSRFGSSPRFQRTIVSDISSF